MPRSPPSSRAWTWRIPAWCNCTGGGPAQATRAPAVTWPTTEGRPQAMAGARVAQPITTVTTAPPGMNVRCTRGLPGPVTVTLIVAVSPAASVPDIGAMTTFFSRPAGSEIDQFTGPPDAVTVIEPLAGGVTSSVDGLTLSVPAAASSLVLGLGLGSALLAPADEGTAVALTVGNPTPELALAIGSALGCAVALAGVVPPGPGVPVRPSLPRPGTALPVTLGVAAPAGGTPWCSGTAIQVTPAATAAAVPAAAPACAGRACHHGAPG